MFGIPLLRALDPDYPAVGDVEYNVAFRSSLLTGTFVVPAQPDVELNVQYGAGGTEFTGSLIVTGGTGHRGLLM